MSSEIPDWNEIGVLPPMSMLEPTSPARSPYKTTVIELINRYAFTKQRAEILSGFLNFRRHIYEVGVIDGFQWVDGSFTENIELTEARPPNDIDVVTFYFMPDGLDQMDLINRNANLFLITPEALDWRKNTLKVDAYWEDLQLKPNLLIEKTVYWYSMWSHKRDLSWKGFLQIPLSQQNDIEAINLLDEIISGGFNE